MGDCETVSVAQAARLLGFGRTRTYAAVRSGRLPALRVGRKARIPLAVIGRLLEHPEEFNTASPSRERRP